MRATAVPSVLCHVFVVMSRYICPSLVYPVLAPFVVMKWSRSFTGSYQVMM